MIAMHSLDALICRERRRARFYGRIHAGCMACLWKKLCANVSSEQKQSAA